MKAMRMSISYSYPSKWSSYQLSFRMFGGLGEGARWEGKESKGEKGRGRHGVKENREGQGRRGNGIGI